jgi:hypothetical protein
MAGFHRINVQLTERQYRVLMAESNAAGLRVGTIARMLLHDDIASGRASKFLRMRQSRDNLQNSLPAGSGSDV